MDKPEGKFLYTLFKFYSNNGHIVAPNLFLALSTYQIF